MVGIKPGGYPVSLLPDLASARGPFFSWVFGGMVETLWVGDASKRA